VSGTEPIGCDHLDRVLADLGCGAITAVAGDARLVAGDAGTFVLLPGGDAPAAAAERAARLAEATREALADHLSWVPFVDAVVVVRPGEALAGTATAGPATAVPIDLLIGVLSEGRHLVAVTTLARIAALLADGGLGAWCATTLEEGDRIDLCSPVDATAAGPVAGGRA
jgi:hypothetical protein